MKYSGINLTKYAQDLYEENYKTDERIRDLSKWKDTPCSWIGILNIVKMSVLPKLIYRFSAIPIKIPGSYFVDVYKLILKFVSKGKRTRILKEKT